jgi:hypothetical protein
MKEKEIIAKLLNEFKNLTPDLNKSKGDPSIALAERLIIIINKLTPHANLFNDSFKIKIKEYIITYEAARKGEEKGKNIFKLVKPTNDLILQNLEDKLIK